jgi:peptide-methionine (R)-S-oxide reductase
MNDPTKQPPLQIDRRALLMGAGGIAGLCTLSLATQVSAKDSFSVRLNDDVWRRKLGADRFAILRRDGTERAYSSPLLNEKRRGTYHCAGCDQPLFSSAAKYDSRTGWPSFTAALPGKVGYRRDTSLGMIRIEEHCSRCGGHLGHRFDDGPRPTGKRHCINGLSLTFKPA